MDVKLGDLSAAVGGADVGDEDGDDGLGAGIGRDRWADDQVRVRELQTQCNAAQARRKAGRKATISENNKPSWRRHLSSSCHGCRVAITIIRFSC